MFKLVAATLAALYGVLLVFGDEARRPAEVSRAEPAALSLVSVSALPQASSGAAMHMSDISDREAIKLAIAAAEKHRTDQKAALQSTRASNVQAREPAPTIAEPKPELWYVTGARVNLRGGPGTSNAVIGQVSWGAEAEVLADKDGWYQIRLADGSSAGWIFGQFLDNQRPG
ncbi:MAG: SH3 domain-containing protein [Pseudomonadota bacterium]